MKRMILASLALAFATGMCWAQKEEADSTDRFKFKDLKTVKTTSVKDQNKSGTCWSFSGTSFLEEEIIRNGGDSLDLSEMFVVRQCYLDKADRYVRMYGQASFGAGGSCYDVPYIWDKYGILPNEVYNGLNYGEDNHVHAEIDALLKNYLETVVKKSNSRKVSTAWRDGYIGILDAYFGKVPETFEYEGKTYTPQEYAKSLGISKDDYISITSFTHHPFYEGFVLEVPDNWLYERYMNVPMEEMKAIVDNAIENGYTVAWGADVSEPGFKWTQGVAMMPEWPDEKNLEGTELARWVKLSKTERAAEKNKIDGPMKEITVTQELRQEMFDKQETTDDHGMVIMGIAEDAEGNRYYKVKNSWTADQVFGGYLYVSMPYFLAKTMDIMVNKNAVPKSIAKKFK